MSAAKMVALAVAVGSVIFIAVSTQRKPPATAFQFQIPEGWQNLSDPEHRSALIENLPSSVREAFASTPFEVYAVIDRNQDETADATFSVVQGDGDFPITQPGWDTILSDSQKAAQQAGGRFQILESQLTTMEQATVGRAILEIEMDGTTYKQLAYFIPGYQHSAMLTYASQPEQFAEFLPTFEASAQATRGAARFSISDWIRILHNRLSTQTKITFLVTLLALSIAYLLLDRWLKRPHTPA